MSFRSPLLLLGLVGPALALVGYVWLQRRPARYAVRYPNLAVLAEVVGTASSWRRHLPAGLLLSSLAVLAVALARPTITVAAPQERAAVVLVVDTSGSMRATDVKPTRLGAAQEAMRRFLAAAPRQLNIGVVSFSTDVQVVASATRDRARVRSAVDQLAPGFGTAIGDGLARAVGVARSATRGAVDPRGRKPLSAIVLLSDGMQTRGVRSPDDAAELARRAGIRVYTVALGTDGGTIDVEVFGEHRIVPVPPDRETLARIAEETDGKAFDAADASRLRGIYGQLGSSLGRAPKPREVTVGLVVAGAMLLLGAAAASGVLRPLLP